MKLILIFILLTIFNLTFIAQIDQNVLIIGRNVGSHTFHDGVSTRIFGFTSTLSADAKIPGPTIFVNSGDSVKIDFFNLSQGAPHTIHLHGLDVDQANDGVPMLSFEVQHTEHGYYYFKAPHPGTYLYHCHVGSAIHLQAGMYGLVIVRPTNGSTTLNWDGGESYDREFALLATEIDTVWHNDTILDHEHMEGMPLYVPSTFEPQYFMINGLSGSQLADPSNHLYAQPNDKVYMRLANIGYYGVRFIFPESLNPRTVSSDGRPLPSVVLSDTIDVFPGERYETFIQLGEDLLYPFIVEHFNLNTQVVESQQTMYLHTSFASLTELNDFSPYPNPTNGQLIISTSEPKEYAVFSISGRKVLSGKGINVNLQSMESGTYLLRVEGKIHKVILN
jgi:FtsP/CotA-like multicopper oxidase with cupredoxin domain